MSHATTTTALSAKNILFTRNGVEEILSISPTNSDERLSHAIKVVFDLPFDCQPVLRNANTNIIMGDIQACTLLADPNENPRYEIIISEDRVLASSWYGRLWQRFILPFLGK